MNLGNTDFIKANVRHREKSPFALKVIIYKKKDSTIGAYLEKFLKMDDF